VHLVINVWTPINAHSKHIHSVYWKLLHMFRQTFVIIRGFLYTFAWSFWRQRVVGTHEYVGVSNTCVCAHYVHLLVLLKWIQFMSHIWLLLSPWGWFLKKQNMLESWCFKCKTLRCNIVHFVCYCIIQRMEFRSSVILFVTSAEGNVGGKWISCYQIS
jgi:hypothetical protein